MTTEQPSATATWLRRRGLPRPRADGLPVPWGTLVEAGQPQWKAIDCNRILHCQSHWECQVCGLALPDRAWVLHDADGWILTDAAMHRACLSVARRWCPHLRAGGVTAREVSTADIAADGTPLPHWYSLPEVDDEWGSYGDAIKTWTIADTTTGSPGSA
ncbi:hypothetical protein ACWIGI_41385 [Nocardia sp. NPDC055321]